MTLDVELLPVDASFSHQLLLTVLPRVGLAKGLADAVVLIANSAVLVNGEPVTDLNYRMPPTCTVVVGLHGVELTGGK